MDKFTASLKGKFSSLAPKLQSIAQDTYKRIKDVPNQLQPLKEQLSLQFKPTEGDFIHLTDNLFWMNFPSNNKIQALAKYLNQNYQNYYYIWNLSEHQFPTEHFQNQVANHAHPGHPCPSLMELLMICKNILIWLSSDPENVAIVNCQQTKGRSIIILSIILALQTGLNPGETLVKVCQMTNVKDFQALFPSQHLYLTYAENLLNGLQPNITPIKLQSVIFSHVPEVKGAKNKFTPYLQLFSNGKIIYNSLSGGDIQHYQKEDISILFDVGGLQVTDDILVRCKHFESNQVRVSLFRIMFHTGFVFGNFLRFTSLELDVTSNFIVPKEFFIDFIFKRESQQFVNQEQTILSKLVDECKGIVRSNDKLQLDSNMFAISQTQRQIDQNQKPAFSITGDTDSSSENTSGRPSLESLDSYKKISNQKNQQQEEQPLIEPSPLDNHSDDEDKEPQEQDNGEKKILMEKILGQIHKDEDINDDDDLDDYITNLEKE